MPQSEVYYDGAIFGKTVTQQQSGSLALTVSGGFFMQNGGIQSIYAAAVPTPGGVFSTGATLNAGVNLRMLFYYDGPQIVSSQAIQVSSSINGVVTFNYAYWADAIATFAWVSTAGGSQVLHSTPLDVEFDTGVRIVPRDSYSDSTGRKPQQLYVTGYATEFLNYDRWWTRCSISTAGLPDPRDNRQPGRLWGIGDTTFANASTYASGATGITFPQAGGIQWMRAALRTNYGDADAQAANMNIQGFLKFFYDGPQVMSTATVSVTVDGVEKVFNYAYDKDVPIGMYCVTTDGVGQRPSVVYDCNRSFKRPIRIVPRDSHAEGTQKIHARIDFYDPFDLQPDNIQGYIGFATVEEDLRGNFKGS